MGWFFGKSRGQGTAGSTEARARIGAPLGRVETLQPRLCLGGVTSPATGSADPYAPQDDWFDQAATSEVAPFDAGDDCGDDLCDVPVDELDDGSYDDSVDGSFEDDGTTPESNGDGDAATWDDSSFETTSELSETGEWQDSESVVDDETFDKPQLDDGTLEIALYSVADGESGEVESGTDGEELPPDGPRIYYRTLTGLAGDEGETSSDGSTNSGSGDGDPGDATVNAGGDIVSTDNGGDVPFGGDNPIYYSMGGGVNGGLGSGNTAITAETLAMFGFSLDEHGNAIATPGAGDESAGGSDGAPRGTPGAAWWQNAEEPVVVRYDFRDLDGAANQITEAQRAVVEQSLQAWSDATGGQVVFERDENAPHDQILNLGVGQLLPLGEASAGGGTLSLGGGRVTQAEDGSYQVRGVAWMDVAENWDAGIGNGNPQGTIDFFTAASHEIGHVLGYHDARVESDAGIMRATYTGERLADAIQFTVSSSEAFASDAAAEGDANDAIDVEPLLLPGAQLTAADVQGILQRASMATASQDAIIAVVDRNGRILGVRVEQAILDAAPNIETLVFMIDGAVAKARTAAFFSSDAAALTSRTIQYISQSTVAEREVEGNPNADRGSQAAADASTTRGPGFVAPIGLGGHFPPGVPHTPPVDLFAIEHTNRDSNLAPGADGVKGTGDDVALRTFLDGLGRVRGRFNIDTAFVPVGQGLFAPESYGNVQNSGLLADATSRGIATLPGGIPLFRDTNGDRLGDHLVGGVGVFFPGVDGFATHEQGFVPGIGQTQEQRVQNGRSLEAEFIALVAAGGSITAQSTGILGASVPNAQNLDVPLTRIDLVGLTLPAVGNIPGRLGVETALHNGFLLGPGIDSGADQPLNGTLAGQPYRAGEVIPEGWLVMPHAGGGLTAADVQTIIDRAIIAANETRAAIRPLRSRTKMVFAVTDTTGEILGLYRMPDATVFSIDVAVAKARNVAYYSDAADLQAIDAVTTPGVAFTNRTFRFLAEPRYPSGVDGTTPPPFSILNDPGVNPANAENLGAPTPAGQFDTVLGNDAFRPMSNFRDPGDAATPAATANQNGIVFFPGSTPLYVNGVLVGGFGVSGDGVDQDDVVTYNGAFNYLPDHVAVRADQVVLNDVRLPFIKFNRNPFG